MNTLILLTLISQFPQQPDKQQPQALAAPLAAPGKATPLASPQATTFASPQQNYQAAPVQAQVILRAVPQVYAIQRQVVVQADPVVYSQVAYAASDPCVVQQQQVIRQTVLRQQVVQHSSVVSHGLIQSATVNHALIGGAGRQPRKIITKQITKTKRGLLGGLFGG